MPPATKKEEAKTPKGVAPVVNQSGIVLQVVTGERKFDLNEQIIQNVRVNIIIYVIGCIL